MIRLLLVFVVLVFVGALLRLAWLRWHQRPGRLLASVGVAALVVLLILAVATGRLHWLYTIPAALLALASRVLPFWGTFKRVAGAASGGSGTGAGNSSGEGRSRVSARFLEMELDHATGRLNGTIREGEHAGRALSELRFDTLMDLLAHYRLEDPDSARLLETWLDRSRGSEWRARDPDAGAGARAGEDREAPTGPGGDMDRAEALDVLGLTGTPDRDAVVQAHRRLMQRFHPDRGGSDYLAAQLNRAKDRLLADLQD